MNQSDSPYLQWPNGPSARADYFPIGVWVQDPRNARAYQDIGVNVYVGLWQGPTEEQLAALSAVGMRVICAQNAVGLAHRDDPTIIAWMHGDEPDNAQADGNGGWGPAVDPERLAADYRRWRANDPTRPIWLNLGQGVANDDWVGRAAPDEYYPRYIEATDIVSFDVYPVVGIRRDDGERFLWYVAKGVDRLRQWGQDARPVWNVIETTRINNPTKKATPHQVKAEVWMSIIHGSRGIVYFAHEWEPRFVEAGLLADEQMREGVGAINRQIHDLAPVLNSPTLPQGVVVESAVAEIPVDALVKRWGGATYVFAVPMRQGPTRAQFTVSGLSGRGQVEVLGEERTIALVDGRFADDFATYQVQLYRLVDGD
ncbi:MAG: hypothetical protein GKR89_08640 [Candidatus Latescibacteria bacterium]|nr:hypothetical protein [Candidatus Latescibacterota bacterium]